MKLQPIWAATFIGYSEPASANRPREPGRPFSFVINVEEGHIPFLDHESSMGHDWDSSPITDVIVYPITNQEQTLCCSQPQFILEFSAVDVRNCGERTFIWMRG